VNAGHASRNSTSFLSDERSRWQSPENGNQLSNDAMTLLLGHERGATRIDFKRRTITDLVGVKVGLSARYPDLSPSLDSAPAVLLFKFKEIEYWLNILEKPAKPTEHYTASLEARWPVDGKAKTLLNRINITNISTLTKASPNRLYAVLKYEEPVTKTDEPGSRVHYVIVDNAGNIVDRLFFRHVDRPDVDVVSGMPEDVLKKAK
jgi:hypothetical protein